MSAFYRREGTPVTAALAVAVLIGVLGAATGTAALLFVGIVLAGAVAVSAAALAVRSERREAGAAAVRESEERARRQSMRQHPSYRPPIDPSTGEPWGTPGGSR